RAAAELGVEVIYRGPDKADELKQKEILESFITQKVDGIAISVLNASFLTPAIDRAIEAGIPVVTWDSDAPESKRIAFYGVDDFQSGLVMGEETAKLLGGTGTVAFITSLGANNLQRRLEGARQSLARYPGISIVETYDIKEDSTRCQELIATGSNRYPTLGAWISVGGWPVFSANALEPVPATTKFVSFDTVDSALKLLRAGKVQVLLGQKYFGWGGESVRLLDGIIKGNRPAQAIIDSGVDVVTMANVDAYEAAWKAMVSGGRQ
ncbi:MAG: substrate-binding domain-containing protein, partial [Acidobacteria bacterium]|nr:substrate-binding domain-containing protein [Acidobacteriota bacterium]